MTMSHDELKRSVMRRVYAYWVLRRTFNSFSVRVYAMVASLIMLRQFVSVKHVLINSPSFFDLSATFGFWTHALVNAETGTQLALAALAVLGLWLMRDTARRISAGSRALALATQR